MAVGFCTRSSGALSPDLDWEPPHPVPDASVSTREMQERACQTCHALVTDLRATFFDYDYDLKKEFDQRQADHGKEEEEGERIVRLLEDVMRKVQ
jgi:hypothetical protein